MSDAEPEGFGFDSSPTTLLVVVSVVPPVGIGLLAVRKRTVLGLAAVHAASPLLSRPKMWAPTSELNFANLLWWFPRSPSWSCGGNGGQRASTSLID